MRRGAQHNHLHNRDGTTRGEAVGACGGQRVLPPGQAGERPAHASPCLDSGGGFLLLNRGLPMTRLLSRRALVVQAALLAAAAPGVLAQTNPNLQGNTASGKLAPTKTAATRPAAAVVAPVAVEWPTKPIRLLIGFPPGSVQDLSARSISEQLSKALGQPVIVENKAGASGTIAADQVCQGDGPAHLRRDEQQPADDRQAAEPDGALRPGGTWRPSR
jgi:hypothetical protein